MIFGPKRFYDGKIQFTFMANVWDGCPDMQSAVPPLSATQKKEVEEAFDLFDADRTGYIDYHELKVNKFMQMSPCMTFRLQPSSSRAIPTSHETCASVDVDESIGICCAQARCAANCSRC